MDKNNTSRRRKENSEEEVDIIEIIKRVWTKRRFILKLTVIFACVGIFVAIFSSKEYTAGCTIVPQTNKKNVSGNLGGLAAMAGINLGGGDNSEVLSPKMYPMILASVPFQKELMQARIKFNNIDQPVSLLEYYTNEKYKQFNLLGNIKKYTIGLPGVIIGVIRGKKSDVTNSQSDSLGIEMLTDREKNCVNVLTNRVILDINEKDGYVNLMASMPEPLAAAQLASHVKTMLQKYITEFKIQKAQSNLDFIENRYMEAKQDFELKQQELAEFNDANLNFVSERAKTNKEKLKTAYDLAFSVYLELAKQREQANIQVKETTPIFTVVNPVTIPTERSKPKRAFICVAFTFLGGILGIGLVLILPFLAQISGNRRLAAWLPEETIDPEIN